MTLTSTSFPLTIILFLLLGRHAETLSLRNAKQQPQDTAITRRHWLSTVTASGAAGIFLPAGSAADASSSSSLGPIAVLGANGRTGAYCVTACLARGLPVLALTRSGSWNPPVESNVEISNNNGKLLTVAACDIKDPTALASNLKGCRGVIYAASASKKGGNAAEIDNVGVVSAGDVCLAEKIPRYIVISSTSTTRPKSLGYIFTNLSVGGIMDAKRLGEQGLQTAYQTTSGGTTTPSFTIVRPGGLEEPKKNEVLGPSALEITQGDVLAGIVSRADLAEVAVELAASNAPNLRNTALELYYTDSTIPVDRQFKSMMTSGVVPRLHGDTYAELFQGIKPGIDYYVPS